MMENSDIAVAVSTLTKHVKRMSINSSVLLARARTWLEKASPHGDNCHLFPTGEYARCFCGLDDLLAAIDAESDGDSLIAALAPFVAAYRKSADDIGDSDLYDDQPRAIHVTLGDCRRAARCLARICG